MAIRRTVRLLVVLMLLSGTLVATASSGAAGIERDDPALRLKAAEISPARGADVDAAVNSRNLGYYLVQFDGPILQSQADALHAAGGDIVAYVPDFAYKVRMTRGMAADAARLDGVRFIGPFEPEYKLSPDLAAEGVYWVRVERGGVRVATETAIVAAGAEVLGGNGSIVVISADRAMLDAVAAIADVAWIENFTLREKHNEYGAGVIIGANASPYDGSTQIVAVADTGLGDGSATGAHPDISASRIVSVQDWPGVSSRGCYRVFPDGAQDVDSGHGTHVAVSVLGSGNATGLGRGTAPGAGLVFQAVEDYADMRSVCALSYPDGYYLLGLPEDLQDLLQAAYDDGARIHSDSWGSSVAGQYTADAASVDTFIWNNPDFLMTTSAGNAGVDGDANGEVDEDSMGSPATAKNLLTVGASENDRRGDWSCDATIGNDCTGQNTLFTYGEAWPADYPANPVASDPSAGHAEQLAAFSSRGPTDDGRIKPDVVAPGTWIVSGYSDLYQEGYDGVTNPRNGAFQYDGWGFPVNEQYKYMGGTSMSNPIVAGAAAVVRDYYEKAHGHSASAALTKASLINSAVDLVDENNDGFNDNDYPIPNNHEGWGLVNLADSVDGSAEWVDEAAGLATNGTASYSYTTGGGTDLRVSLVWSDYPSTETAAVNLVNDLDLTVSGPGGTFTGNVFSGGWSATGGSADRVNNVENVYVQNAAAGTWTVTVSGFNVPMGPQPFALVVDGVGPATPNVPPVAGFTSSCSDLDCDFTDASTDGDGSVVSWSWDFGDGTTSTAQNPSHSYAAGGTYTVGLTVTDNGGGTDTASGTVTVTAPVSGGTVHIVDLDGYGVSQGKAWNAFVDVYVGDGNGDPVENATVTGTWRRGQVSSCITDKAGYCEIVFSARGPRDTFTVSDITHAPLTYAPADNTDPDGDSDGTSITISRP